MKYPSREEQSAAMREYNQLLDNFIKATSELSRFSSNAAKDKPRLLASIWSDISQRINARLVTQKMFAEKGNTTAQRLIVALPFALAWIKNDSLESFGNPYTDQEIEGILEELNT